MTTQASAIHVAGLDHFVLRVRDLDRSLAFYRDLLGLHIDFLDDYRAGRRPFVSVCIGEQLLDLLPDTTYDPNVGLSAGGFMHLCVRVGRPAMAELIPLLKTRGVELIDEQPVPRMGATGMGLSIYVRDPDGYVVELKEQNVGRVEG
jgi:catechol 2,3-dioxygenase-like lactoylglutathione lyase family enzyme